MKAEFSIDPETSLVTLEVFAGSATEWTAIELLATRLAMTLHPHSMSASLQEKESK